MKRKKLRSAIVGTVLVAVLITLICIGVRILPEASAALRIARLLQPLMEAEEQAVHISLSAELRTVPLALESDIYAVMEDDTRFIAVTTEQSTVYITEDILLLENGKAFQIGQQLQLPQIAPKELLSMILTLYDVLDITSEQTKETKVYSVTATAQQAEVLMRALALPAQGVEKLKINMTERNGALDRIDLSGSGNLDGTPVRLDATLSDFRILEDGDYVIPETVRESAAFVDPDTLISLTEDLYRLLQSLLPLIEMDTIPGTLTLAVDCGILQLDTQIPLDDLKSITADQLDSQQLLSMPETLGWLCMEGELHCSQNGDSYEYTLELDRTATQELAAMILPQLAAYGKDMTGGSASVNLQSGKITSMEVRIEGQISALIVNIPIHVGAKFVFS